VKRPLGGEALDESAALAARCRILGGMPPPITTPPVASPRRREVTRLGAERLDEHVERAGRTSGRDRPSAICENRGVAIVRGGELGPRSAPGSGVPVRSRTKS